MPNGQDSGVYRHCVAHFLSSRTLPGILMAHVLCFQKVKAVLAFGLC